MNAFDSLSAWLAHPATIVIGVAVAIIAARSVRFVRDDQRMIVERLGRFSRIRGPGWQILIPFVERAVVMQPERFLPGWRGYSAAQLETTLIREFYGQGAPGLANESMAGPEAMTSAHRKRDAALRQAREAAKEAAEREKRLTPGGTEGP